MSARPGGPWGYELCALSELRFRLVAAERHLDAYGVLSLQAMRRGP